MQRPQAHTQPVGRAIGSSLTPRRKANQAASVAPASSAPAITVKTINYTPSRGRSPTENRFRSSDLRRRRAHDVGMIRLEHQARKGSAQTQYVTWRRNAPSLAKERASRACQSEQLAAQRIPFRNTPCLRLTLISPAAQRTFTSKYVRPRRASKKKGGTGAPPFHCHDAPLVDQRRILVHEVAAIVREHV